MSCSDSTRDDFADFIREEGQPVDILVKPPQASVHDDTTAAVAVSTYAIIKTSDIRANANVPALASASFTVLFADDPVAFGVSAAAIRTASGTADTISVRWSLTGGAVTDQPQTAAMIALLERALSGGELFKHSWALGGVT